MPQHSTQINIKFRCPLSVETNHKLKDYQMKINPKERRANGNCTVVAGLHHSHILARNQQKKISAKVGVGGDR